VGLPPRYTSQEITFSDQTTSDPGHFSSRKEVQVISFKYKKQINKLTNKNNKKRNLKK